MVIDFDDDLIEHSLPSKEMNGKNSSLFCHIYHIANEPLGCYRKRILLMKLFFERVNLASEKENEAINSVMGENKLTFAKQVYNSPYNHNNMGHPAIINGLVFTLVVA